MLAYRLTHPSEGKEASVVLLHAFPFSSFMWLRERKELSEHAAILAPDLPGFGASDRLKKPSITGMAEAVADLLDSLEIEEPVVMGGLSMGGYVALEFYRHFPDRVRGLMLFSTCAAADTAAAKEKRLRAIEEIEKGGVEEFSQKNVNKMVGKTTLETRPDIVEKALTMMLDNQPEGLTDALRAMADRRDNSDLLNFITCPTLIVAGEEDTIIAPAEAESMHKKIRDSRFYRMPKTGHLLNLERPDIFGTMVENFLGTGIHCHSISV